MTERLHSLSLDFLIKNLNLIDEDPNNIEWLMREGFYYEVGNKQQKSFCDILIGYGDSYRATALELKKSRLRRPKALEQLSNGVYLLNSWGYQDISQKIVYYGGGKLEYEIIDQHLNNVKS